MKSLESKVSKKPLAPTPAEQTALFGDSQSHYYGSTQTILQSSHASSRSGTLASTPPPSLPLEPMSSREIFMYPAVQRVLIAYAAMALVTVSVDAVTVLWLFTPVAMGGIGFSVSLLLATLFLRPFPNSSSCNRILSLFISSSRTTGSRDRNSVSL